MGDIGCAKGETPHAPLKGAVFLSLTLQNAHPVTAGLNSSGCSPGPSEARLAGVSVFVRTHRAGRCRSGSHATLRSAGIPRSRSRGVRTITRHNDLALVVPA